MVLCIIESIAPAPRMIAVPITACKRVFFASERASGLPWALTKRNPPQIIQIAHIIPPIYSTTLSKPPISPGIELYCELRGFVMETTPPLAKVVSAYTKEMLGTTKVKNTAIEMIIFFIVVLMVQLR